MTTPFETAVLSAATSGTWLDARTAEDEDICGGDAWGPERTMGSELLEALVTGEHGPVHRRGVRLAGVRIQGPVDLSWTQPAQPLSLVACWFDGPVRATGATFKELVLSGCRLAGLDLTGASVAGDVLLDGIRCTGAEIRLVRTTIGGQLSLRGARLANPGGCVIDAGGATVTSSVLLDGGFSATGRVHLPGCEIGGELNLHGAALANHGGCAFDAGGATVKSSVFLDGGFSAAGEVRFPGAHIGGQLRCVGATLTNPGGPVLDAGSVTVGSSMVLDDVTADGEVRLPGAHIGGELTFRRARLTRPGAWVLDAGTATVEKSVLLHESFSARGHVHLAGADMGRLVWDDTHVEGVLDLQDASVKQLADHWTQLGGAGRGARVDGFRYESLADDGTGLDLRLKWLRSSPGFTPQPYSQLASVYRASGHDDLARRVLIERENDRRDRGGMSWWPTTRSRLLGAIVAHGYRPIRAVVALVALVAIGAGVLYSARHEIVATKAPTPTTVRPSDPPPAPPAADTCPAAYACFNPVVFSAEVVIPIIKLGQTDKWQPVGRNTAAQIWVWVATALGWLFTTLAVAGVTGLIRRD